VTSLPGLHRALDRAAMWAEDGVSRAARPFRPAPATPLGCWGALPALPAIATGPGVWRLPSPAPAAAGDELVVRVHAARRARCGVALLVPPWKIRHPRVVAGWVRLLATAGWEPWLYTPPHHLERTAPGARNGEGFVSPDLGEVRATFERVVLELRTLAAVAAGEGPVGIVGLSLGALAAALTATGGEPLAFAALVAPPDLALSLATTRIGERYRKLAVRAGAPLPPLAVLGAQLAPLSPALRRPSAARVLVAAGEHDIIVPPEAPLALARAWGVSPRVYPRGHLTLLFACRALRRDVAALLS
jgi:predicted alpha/beta hydrolase family esterase